MPNIKSAKKRVLTAEKKAMENKMYVSSLKTAIKKAMDDNNGNNAENINMALKLLDKSVSKGVLHKNTAARKKSMLAMAGNQK
ncbi:MAG: 30S ribosomal protein S20 [Oscillospiraceae bacterium]|nr:30S ribosomal protein S20 [Oscillospiraceae bacterium]